jgi:hypothetical protein
MYTLVLITSLAGQFHHDLFIHPTITNFSSEQECKDAGLDLGETYKKYNNKVEYTVKCYKVK